MLSHRKAKKPATQVPLQRSSAGMLGSGVVTLLGSVVYTVVSSVVTLVVIFGVVAVDVSVAILGGELVFAVSLSSFFLGLSITNSEGGVSTDSKRSAATQQRWSPLQSPTTSRAASQ